MYGEPKEHVFYELSSGAWHKGRDDQGKLAAWHEIF
jgi:hypothetical protein